jgi:hypothetical protein
MVLRIEAGAQSSMSLTECTDDFVVRRSQEERTKLASWEEFPDGVLPDVWSPFCPIKWLAQYLHQHNPTLRYEAPVTPKQWSQLSREEKVEMCFTHLDRDGNGTQPQPMPLLRTSFRCACNVLRKQAIPVRCHRSVIIPRRVLLTSVVLLTTCCAQATSL